MEKLNKLVELAKKATPGKWWIDSHGHTMVVFSGEAGGVEVVFATDNDMGPLVRHEDTGNLSHWRNDNDATFIAAANPTTILTIAEAFRALEQRAEAADAALERESDIHIDTAESMREWRLRAEAAEAKLAELEKQEPNTCDACVHVLASLGFNYKTAKLKDVLAEVKSIRSASAVSLVELVTGDYSSIRLQKAKLWIDRILMDKPGMKEAQTVSTILRNIEEAE